MADPRCPTGLVFRRLDAGRDRRQAVRLLAGCGLDDGLDDQDPSCLWYGLSDLTETETRGLAGVVVVRSVEPGTARLCALAVAPAYRGHRLGRRLVCEVSDRLRASGTEEISAPPTLDHRVAVLLTRMGFTPAVDRPQGGGPGWLRLPL
jgi:GNAT superfamily N-acetyltransferase